MRGLAVSVAVALSMCGAALGAGWAVQSGVLPRAPRASHVAADAASWLLRYRIVAASLRVDGRRESTLCLHSWFPRTNGTLGRGTLLVLRNGTTIADQGGRIDVVKLRGPAPRSLLLLFELAGCPGTLGKRVATAAVDGGIGLVRAFAAGRPALALRLPHQRDRLGPRRSVTDRATLYVSARTYRPLAVSVALGSEQGVARLWLVRATGTLLARFAVSTPQTPGARP